MRRVLVLLVALALAACAAVPAVAGGKKGDGRLAAHSLRAPVTDETFYFVMADRFENGSTANDLGGLPADPLVSGFDPTRKGFYHGGDLQGLLQRIDYIRGLGVTSIWLTPSFKNKAVQLEDGPSAGYHGYWITDFTQIDPHLGTNADLRAVVDAAHERGMKVYFDIITNHTADVIGYEEGARQPYVSKDEEPYRTADGTIFDDRDYAGSLLFPALDPDVSFPYRPVLDPVEQSLKVPAWLNDLTLYHNRGDTTFVGENSLYGDFFGLDDLFTEHPRVVQGMIDIYKTWIADFGVDGFRIDTMKHVDDAFWQRFGPEVLAFARAQGKREFFMFGEVFDTTKSFTSHFTTTDRMQAVIDFPFQNAARRFASQSLSADELRVFFAGDDWYTDADSNVYGLPTFLGNHDMGRIGNFVKSDNPGAVDAELMARDLLAHELMYLSRGNPVVYYGDEQGFVGDGGDQDARQDMFPSQVATYNDDDLIGTDATTAVSNFDPTHPLYRAIGKLARLTQRHEALRDGAQIHRLSATAAGLYAFSRIDRRDQREYVVVLNNSEQPQTATIPTYSAKRDYLRVYGEGRRWLESNRSGGLTVTVGPLSAIVYKLWGQIPRSKKAPRITLGEPTPAAESRARIEVPATVDGTSFYEVTFLVKADRGAWTRIGTDDSPPYRVFHDVSALPTGTPLKYKAVVLDNKHHTRVSDARSTAVPAPKVTIEVPAEGSRVRDTVSLRAVVDPERATHVVRFERMLDGGEWTLVGSDDSSPAYSADDDISVLDLAPGTPIHYRAVLTEPDGTTATSDVRTVAAAGPPLEFAVVRYFRPAADYTNWGLHLWGEAVDPDVLAMVAWDRPWPLTRIEGAWAVYEIPLEDDTQAVNFIMHLPSGDTVPDTREPGGDRSFIPLDHPEIWLKQGDPAVYFSQPPVP